MVHEALLDEARHDVTWRDPLLVSLGKDCVQGPVG
jgi:hypothetical protein